MLQTKRALCLSFDSYFVPTSQKALLEKHIEGEMLELNRADGLVEILNSLTLMKVIFSST